MTIFAYAEKIYQKDHLGHSLSLRFYPNNKKSQIQLVVHSVSSQVIVFEGDANLEIGDRIEVILRHSGPVYATITSKTEKLLTCSFDTALAYASLSAAPLRDILETDQLIDTENSQGLQKIETLGQRIVRLRKGQNLTQADLAGKLSVSMTAVSCWERDRARPKAGRIESLSKILDTPIAELLGHDGFCQSSEEKSLSEVVHWAREQIARVAGTISENVKIQIEM